MSSEMIPAYFGKPVPAASQLPAVRQADLKALFDDPQLMLPPSWRPHVLSFFMYFSSALRDQLELCTRLRSWAENSHVELADVLVAFRRMKTPEMSERLKSAWDVMPTLGSYVADAKRDRLGREEVERLRRAPTEAERQTVSDMVAEMRRRWSVDLADSSAAGAKPEPAGRRKRRPPAGPAAE